MKYYLIIMIAVTLLCGVQENSTTLVPGFKPDSAKFPRIINHVLINKKKHPYKSSTGLHMVLIWKMIVNNCISGRSRIFSNPSSKQ